MAKSPAEGTKAALDLGCVDVTDRGVILREIISDELEKSGGKRPTAKEVDDAVQITLFEKSKTSRLAMFRVEVRPSSTPFPEDVLRISYNGGVDWIAIHLLPEEKTQVISKLTTGK